MSVGGEIRVRVRVRVGVGLGLGKGYTKVKSGLLAMPVHAVLQSNTRILVSATVSKSQLCSRCQGSG